MAKWILSAFRDRSQIQARVLLLCLKPCKNNGDIEAGKRPKIKDPTLERSMAVEILGTGQTRDVEKATQLCLFGGRAPNNIGIKLKVHQRFGIKIEIPSINTQSQLSVKLLKNGCQQLTKGNEQFIS